MNPLTVTYRLFPIFLGLLFAACSRPAPVIDTTYPDPAKFEIRGIDVSAHNGEIDFPIVRDDGFEFVLIKATEGASFKDRRFINNLRRAREAGLKVGAYHFFRFDTPGYMQGLNFLNSVKSRQLDLPLVIDVEEWANPNSQATALVLDRLVEMIDHLERHGYRVMLYTNKNGFARFIRGRLEGYHLWLCSLAVEPEQERWTLWQATHNGRVRGIKGAVDINAFRGTREEWELFATGSKTSRETQ